jgi:hypothetical protein
MDEEQIRRATAAGVTDAFNSAAYSVCVVLCVIAFCAHPLLGIGLLLAWLGLWIVWRVLRWFMPTTWRAWAANRRYVRDRFAFMGAHPHVSGVHRYAQSLSAYEERKAAMRRDGAHVSNWQPFEDWRAKRLDP